MVLGFWVSGVSGYLRLMGLSRVMNEVTIVKATYISNQSSSIALLTKSNDPPSSDRRDL